MVLWPLHFTVRLVQILNSSLRKVYKNWTVLDGKIKNDKKWAVGADFQQDYIKINMHDASQTESLNLFFFFGVPITESR